MPAAPRAAIVRPAIDNVATKAVLPGTTTRGLTGRSSGLFGKAISVDMAEVAELTDNVQGQCNGETRTSNVFRRCSMAVFMAKGRVDLTNVSQYILPTLQNGRDKQSLGLKNSIPNLHTRLQAEVFGNPIIHRYILECFDNIRRRAILDGTPAFETLSAQRVADEMQPYFTKEVFYTLWYPLRQRVNLSELAEKRRVPPNHPANDMHIPHTIWCLSVAIFKVTSHHIFESLELRSKAYPTEDAQIPRMPTTKIYIDVERLYTAFETPHPADLPIPQLPEQQRKVRHEEGLIANMTRYGSGLRERWT